MIIGISGKIGSGKDTVATMIQFLIEFERITVQEKSYQQRLSLYQEYIEFMDETSPKQRGWEIRRFADKLKDIACLLIGCTRE